jgi:hypothetical protein
VVEHPTIVDTSLIFWTNLSDLYAANTQYSINTYVIHMNIYDQKKKDR